MGRIFREKDEIEFEGYKIIRSTVQKQRSDGNGLRVAKQYAFYGPKSGKANTCFAIPEPNSGTASSGGHPQPPCRMEVTNGPDGRRVSFTATKKGERAEKVSQ